MSSERYSALTDKIKASYEQGVTLEEAEKLAGEFLVAQIEVAEELKASDLDSRMRKTGLKSVKAAVYMAQATKSDKKPSDVMLGALVDQDEIVIKTQDEFDVAEVQKQYLESLLGVFREAHIHFRGIAKGRFE